MSETNGAQEFQIPDWRLGGTYWNWDVTVKCPWCHGTNCHLDASDVEDDPARILRGTKKYFNDTIKSLCFESECGSKFEICFAYHEGSTYAFVIGRSSCCQEPLIIPIGESISAD